MKKYNLYILFFIISNTAFSQYSKESLFLSGTANFYATSEEVTTQFQSGDSKEFGFQFNPILQKMITDKYAIGGGFLFQHNNMNSNTKALIEMNSSSSSSSNNTTFGISFNASRFYPISDKLYFTMNGNAYVSRGISKFSPNYYSHQTGLVISPGFDFVLNSSFALTSNVNLFNLYYQSAIDRSVDYKSSGSYFGLSLNQSSLFIGIRYFLKKKPGLFYFEVLKPLI